MSVQYSTVGELLLRKAEDLALDITERQYERQPDLMERFGQTGWEKTKQDTLYTLNYLAESVLVNSPGLFTHYVSWLKDLLRQYRVTQEDLRINFELMREALCAHFDDPNHDIVLDYMDMGLHQIMVDHDGFPSYINESNPLRVDALNYLNLLLEGDRSGAFMIVDHLLDQGTPIKQVYQYIFQMTQYEIGRLWQQGRINVAQEHYCTAATQAIISRLYPRWMAAGGTGYRLVAACVGKEQHEIGLRMLTDIFELEGWDTYYLGANVPDSSLVTTVAQHQPDVVAISATMTFHIHLVKELISKLRAYPATSHVKILVGGFPFSIDPHLWKEVGADGSAAGPDEAVRVAELLLDPEFA
ncbi:cobalamin-dependent protein [Paenibacillus sp. JX-17]|uniref:Cobalamin-dependent protein n=1 Tax=Paenibacillus lacisoli TaxID=3064525 RepID=A0ABT9C9K9_9BACL|nr:cobalamin-dependent protein [Paenibacillus sp. JX-17]MDO7905917.1 cobalamin-dependent protein [Paenibacillus sp. JX-17]